jgi:phage shock protein A
MANESTVEQRLTALEKEVAEWRQRLEEVMARKRDRIDRVNGSTADLPEEEVRKFMEICAEIRRSDRPAGDT